MAEVLIKFLGTGSAFSKKHGNNSAVISVVDEGIKKNLMIDCGRTTPDDMHNQNINWTDIDAIFITHLHGDHVYGLEEAGFMGRYVFNKKPHLILPSKEMKVQLWERVLKGTMARGDLNNKMKFEDYFTYEIVNPKDEYFIFNDIMFSVYVTEHVKNKESYGLIIGEKYPLVYTSDTLFNEQLLLAVVEQFKCQAIFHDCQFVDYDGKVHASLSELSTLPRNIKEKTYLMHYSDDMENHIENITSQGFKIADTSNNYAFTLE